MKNNLKVAVIGAMDCEINTLKECLKDIETIEYGKLTVFKGRIGNNEIILTKSGVGKVCAAINTQFIIDKFQPDCIINTGVAGGIAQELEVGDIVIATGAIRMEGTSKEYAPIEFPAVANLDITNALVQSAKNLGYNWHAGIVQCKDSFYGQHNPEKMPVNYELQSKWDAWKKMGCLASEMESAALFIVGSFLKVKVGSVFLTVANQEREKLNLENPIEHDTDKAIKTAIEAIKVLIEGVK